MGRKPLVDDGTTAEVLRLRVPAGWLRWVRELVKRNGWEFSATVRDILKKGSRAYGWRDQDDKKPAP